MIYLFNIIIILSVFSVVLLLLSLCFLFVADVRIGLWLKRNRPDKWEELSMVGSLGPGLVNPKKGLSYVYSDEDDDQKDAFQLKSTFKRAATISKSLLVCFLILAAALVLLSLIKS